MGDRILALSPAVEESVLVPDVDGVVRLLTEQPAPAGVGPA
ncbi:hypothetical protein [Cryptosporangium aurantiacum]|nr:hypothetical protein [Cryptosporangium aurantiacum]